MKIINIMLSRKLGGLEQSFLDYNMALKSKNIEVINVTSVYAKINSTAFRSIKLLNLGYWDILSALYLRILIFFIKPAAIITHGGRAAKFAFFMRGSCPIISVAHNYKIKLLGKSDYIIALTEHMKEFLLKQGVEESKIHVIPNMVNINRDFIKKNYHQPVVIGAIARFVKNKGLEVLLHSLAKLRDQHYEFKAIIGGSGEEESELIKLSKKLKLEEYVSFIGWVKNQEKFFDQIDIFCVASLREPFGIVVLEAMANSVPIVSTSTEGPSEILRNKKDGLLCETGSIEDLSIKIAYLLNNQAEARKYAENAYDRVIDKYSSISVSTKLASMLRLITQNPVDSE